MIAGVEGVEDSEDIEDAATAYFEDLGDSAGCEDNVEDAVVCKGAQRFAISGR